MFHINSKELKNIIRNNLEIALNSLDGMYISIKDEIKKEILEEKEYTNQANIETLEVYNKLNFDICKKLVKKELPLRIKLLNKINVYGYRLEKTNYISIFFSFNNKDCFTLELHISDIEKFIE